MKALVGILVFASLTAFADIQRESLYRGEDLQSIDLTDVIDRIEPGSVVVLSEYHDNGVHHRHQVEFLKVLSSRYPSLKISVGMEFFEYTDQVQVDAYLNGEKAEDVFLKDIGWNTETGFSFDFYRPLVWYPLLGSGWTYGINAPRSLTSKVARQGYDSLSAQELALLPPEFSLGRDSYRERFVEVISGGHPIPEESVKRYFTAQSIWDDTMAWQTLNVMQEDPEQVFVIIVGDFHNAYGDGLPARLRARGSFPVLTISQVDIEGYSDQEAREEIGPHERWGVRADFVWTN